jgi:hypothetical protein
MLASGDLVNQLIPISSSTLPTELTLDEVERIGI